MKKKVFSVLCCLSIIVASTINAEAGSVTFTNHYGKATGKCSSYTWQQESSPLYRRIDATTTNSGSAPKVTAEVYAKKSGTLVMSAKKTNSYAKVATATDNSEKYVNANLTVYGQHAVWNDKSSRIDYTSTY